MAREPKSNRGKVFRVSDEVHEYYSKFRNEGESWDSVLRRLVNMPNREGYKPGLFEGWALITTRQLYPTAKLARGEALKASMKRGIMTPFSKLERPIRVREVL